jgi:DNA-binding beta-propeller fold protein YncE
MLFRRSVFLSCLCLPLTVAHDAKAQSAPSYIEFEAGPVRPVALSADKTKLFVCNIPDNRLEIFDVTATGLVLSAAIPVGVSPVAVAVRTPTELWVVNQLSDSVSVVDLSASPPRVVRTLLVGDEPSDVVFAANGRAFITTAHRGEQRVDISLAAVPGAGDPQLNTPGVGRADVWVFDPANLGSTAGGVPVGIVTLFGDTPRALAVSGNTVYAAILHSGNQTAGVNEETVCDGFALDAPCAGDGVTSPNGLPNGQLPGGLPPPATNKAGVRAPETGLIVKYDSASGQWKDGYGRNWSNGVRFNLPDKDVFAIDAQTLTQTTVWQHVGTTLYNMAVNPANGKLYVSNHESNNLTRFEGPGEFVKTSVGASYPMASTVQGHIAEARISILGSDGSVTPRRLNPHIDYNVLPAPAGIAERSLSTPLQMVFTQDGSRVLVAAYGSSKIGVIPTAALEGGTFDPNVEAAHYIQLRGGPAGLALDEDRGSLYVLSRFDNSVSRVDVATGTELQNLKMTSPEPVEVVTGRPFLYDALKTSSNGEASCSACHTFGEMDHLAWDLGNPDDVVTQNPLPIKLTVGEFASIQDQNGGAGTDQFHPMKGLMTTQTLKGMVDQGHMHWRGDRSNGELGMEARDAAPFDEHLSFMNFIVATKGLNGRAEEVSIEDMEKFTAFALRMWQPPNPIRRLDNDLTKPHGQLKLGDPNKGREFYFGRVGAPSSFGGPRLVDGTTFGGQGFTCDGCHTNNPKAGFYGTGGEMTFELTKQIFKVAGLRNLYAKIGMFGQPNSRFLVTGSSGPFNHQGDQVRGFGFEHEGTLDTAFRFFQIQQFRTGGFLGGENIGFENDQQRRDVEAYVYAFENPLAPITGQQVTLGADDAASAGARIDLFIARAKAPFDSKLLGAGAKECELIAKVVVNGTRKGFLMKDDGLFYPDDASAPLTDAQLRALAALPGQAVTYTAVPYGSGTRMGIDRDLDGQLDALDTTSDDGAPQPTLPVGGGNGGTGGGTGVGGGSGGTGITPGGGGVPGVDGGVPGVPGPAASSTSGGDCSCRVGKASMGPSGFDLSVIAGGLALTFARLRRRRSRG